MRLSAVVGLLLVIALVSISSYLRLDHAGTGCTPWPECYGNIGAQDEQQADVESAYQRLVAEAREPMSWARPAHRFVASVLGLLVLGMTVAALARRRYRLVMLALLAVTVFLAWLGIYSENLHSPAVVMGNLAGGFLMLGLFGWLVFELGVAPTQGNDSRIRYWTTAALVVLALQILIGGLTSANFAASACATIPHCQGAWFPGSGLWTAFDLSRSIDVSAAGFAVGGAERADIHILHRWVAVIATFVISAAGILAFASSSSTRVAAALVCGVVWLEVFVGVSAVLSDIPIIVAVAHNWLAGILLLSLLYLRAKSP